MAYVVCAKWTAKEGEAENVEAAIRQLAGPSKAEPGILQYQPHRDPENPNVFFFYEQYARRRRLPGPRRLGALQAVGLRRRDPEARVAGARLLRDLGGSVLRPESRLALRRLQSVAVLCPRSRQYFKSSIGAPCVLARLAFRAPEHQGTSETEH